MSDPHTRLVLAAGLIGALLTPSLAAAQAAPAAGVAARAERPMPAIYHAPPGQTPAGEDLRLDVEVPGDWRYESMWVMFRPAGSQGAYTARELKRTEELVHSSLLTGAEVQPPGLEYYIVSRDPEGTERVHFGAPEAPHPVVVMGETAASVMRDKLERHKGNRSEFTLDTNLTTLGSRRVSRGSDEVTVNGSDFYWTAEFGYRYRPLTTLYDFSFGVGRMRGSRGAVALDGGGLQALGSEFGPPGMDYGFGAATVELHRYLSMEGKLILGASDRGFAAGVGGLARIGQIASTNLEISGELVQDVGNSASVRLNWDTVPYVPMSLRIDLTERPGGSTNPLARRLVYEAGVEIGRHVTVTGEVGVASRNDSVDNGIVGGLSAAVAF
jgi:hypothetical protein